MLDLLEKLGKLTDKHDLLEGRVDRLEVSTGFCNHSEKFNWIVAGCHFSLETSYWF